MSGALELLQSLVPVAALGLALVLVGRMPLHPLRDALGELEGLHRAVLHGIAGLLLLHALLLSYGLWGVSWTRGTVLLPLLVATVLSLGELFFERFQGTARSLSLRPRIRWQLLPAALAFAGLASGIGAGWAVNPDFVYHWGIKGHRFFLAGGLDLAFLDLANNWPAHPEYPNLLPELFAVTAILGGGFDDRGLPLWSILFLVALALLARGILLRAWEDGPGGEGLASTGALAISTAVLMFATAHRLPGGADELPAMALMLAIPALCGLSRGRSADVQAALAAALAASSKIEGVILGGWILLAYLVVAGRAPDGPRSRGWPWLRRRLLIALPTMLVVFPWLLTAASRGWFGEPNSGPLQLGHGPVVLATMGRMLFHPSWYGLAGITLILVPWLAMLPAGRPLRPLLAVCAAQLTVYALIYCTALQQPELWVRSSFPRLLVHLVPALLTAAAMAGVRWVREPMKGEAQSRPGINPGATQDTAG